MRYSFSVSQPSRVVRSASRVVVVFGKRVLMLHIVATCIAKSQLQGNCSGLRIFGIGYSPRIVMSQDEEWASSSATSIGTEENSLGVPRARSRVLIYMEIDKQSQRELNWYKRSESSMSHYRTGKETAIEKQSE